MNMIAEDPEMQSFVHPRSGEYDYTTFEFEGKKYNILDVVDTVEKKIGLFTHQTKMNSGSRLEVLLEKLRESWFIFVDFNFYK